MLHAILVTGAKKDKYDSFDTLFLFWTIATSLFHRICISNISFILNSEATGLEMGGTKLLKSASSWANFKDISHNIVIRKCGHQQNSYFALRVIEKLVANVVLIAKGS